jgi:hypothetical protein
MVVCLRLKRFDRGLSMVETDDPDTRDGVRVFVGISGFGKREKLWEAYLVTG